MGVELTSRQRFILHRLVQAHVELDQPVGSKWIAEQDDVPWGPSTVRAELARLEDIGLLEHPHTSAGRVPTDRGYRFFINYLMKSRVLTQRERDAIDDEVSHGNEIEEVLHLASRVISRLSDQVGVIFMPTLLQFAVRSMDFILVAENRIMCILVGTNGVVVNKLVETRLPFTREELEKISRYITVDSPARPSTPSAAAWCG